MYFVERIIYAIGMGVAIGVFLWLQEEPPHLAGQAFALTTAIVNFLMLANNIFKED